MVYKKHPQFEGAELRSSPGLPQVIFVHCAVFAEAMHETIHSLYDQIEHSTAESLISLRHVLTT
jgi:hypothetical protein